MLLSKLFKNAPDIEIEALNIDSRKACKNSIFFCVKGLKTDGHNYIEQAIKNGAIVIVHSDPIENRVNATYIKVNDVVMVLNACANIFYGRPSSILKTYGVTGTNGKTTVTSLIKQYKDAKGACGYIGTLGTIFKDKRYDTYLTTPNVIDLNKHLNMMVEDGCDSCAIEVSSIGIDQRRIEGINFDIAVFTNFTHDHLDYHGSMNEYFLCKKKFFDDLTENSIAITNIDDEVGLSMIADCKCKIISYGKSSRADYMISDIQLTAYGTKFNLTYGDKIHIVNTALAAEFNVYNLVATIAALHESGEDLAEIIEFCPLFKAVEGRMHQIIEGQDYNVFVDFAHTPDGIEKVFMYAKSITTKQNKIIGVFGSAGKRDVAKRKIFGELADKYLDGVILTADDPRDESVVEICEEIRGGIKNINATIIEDRATAIEMAIDMMCAGDTLLILGKGDEKFIYGPTEKIYYDGDDVVAENAIKKTMEEYENEEF